MNGPFPIEAAIELAEQIAGKPLVGNSADLDAALQTPPNRAPAIFIVAEEFGDRSEGVTGKPVQNIGVTLYLVLWVRNAGGAAAVVAAMSQLEHSARAKFFGWRPNSEFKPFSIRASGENRAHGAHLIRQLVLTTSYRQTTEATP